MEGRGSSRHYSLCGSRFTAGVIIFFFMNELHSPCSLSLSLLPIVLLSVSLAVFVRFSCCWFRGSAPSVRDTGHSSSSKLGASVSCI